jgi:hypothetical protein
LDGPDIRRVGERFQEFGIDPQQIGRTRQRGIGMHVDRAQLRHHRVTNEVSRDGAVEIRRILTPCFANRPQKVLQVAPGVFEHGTHNRAAPRRHPGKPACTGPSCQAQQDGFRLVVTRMGERHANGARRLHCIAVKILPGIAAGDLERHAVARGHGRNIGVADERGNLQPRRQLAAELRVGVGLRAANVMMEMSEAGEHEPATRRQLAQHEQQADRIGPTRHGGNDATLRRPQLMPCGVTRDAVDEFVHWVFDGRLQAKPLRRTNEP